MLGVSWRDVLRGAIAAVLLFVVADAHAQSIDVGPLLARGIDPDTLYIKWSMAPSAAAATLYYRKVGAPEYIAVPSEAAVDHELAIHGLQNDSAYEYYVKGGKQTTPVRRFATCPSVGLPLDVVVLGDSRDGGSRVKTIMDLVAGESPDLILETGDIASDGKFETYLAQFIRPAGYVAATIPFMAVPGNHDALEPYRENYARIFAAPREPGDEWRSWYAFGCSNVRFIGLDSNYITNPTQKEFLQRELARAAKDGAVDHVLIFFHHSPYSTGVHGDNPQVQEEWVPLFEDKASKVRAVFTGHDHIYARLGDGSDVMYVITGGAGAPKYPSNGRTSAMTTYTTESAYNYVRLHIAGGLIAATVLDEAGLVLDTFAIGRPSPPPDLAMTLPLEDAEVRSVPRARAGGCNVNSDYMSATTLLIVAMLLLVSSRGAARWVFGPGRRAASDRHRVHRR